MLGQARTIHQFILVSLIGHALPIWVYFPTLWMQLFHHYFVKWQLLKVLHMLLLLLSHLGWSSSAVLFCLLLHVCFTMSSIGGKGHSKRKTKFQNKQPLVSQKKEKSPEYEEIFLQNHPRFHIVKNIAYASNEYHWIMHGCHSLQNCDLWTVLLQPFCLEHSSVS